MGRIVTNDGFHHQRRQSEIFSRRKQNLETKEAARAPKITTGNDTSKTINVSGLKQRGHSIKSSNDEKDAKSVTKIDPKHLLVYYPLSGKPFLSFPPSKSFSTIGKRQTL